MDNTQYIDTTYVLFAFDFVPDSIVPLNDAQANIELRPIGQGSVTITNPMNGQTSDRYWIMGGYLQFL